MDTILGNGSMAGTPSVEGIIDPGGGAFPSNMLPSNESMAGSASGSGSGSGSGLPEGFFVAQYVYLVMSTISFISVGLWGSHQIVTKAFRSTAQRLLLSIALTDFVLAAVSIWDSIALSSPDMISRFPSRWWSHIVIYCLNCTTFWIVALLVHTILRMEHKLNPKTEIRFEIGCHFVVWVLPLPLAYFWTPVGSLGTGMILGTIATRCVVLSVLSLVLVYCRNQVKKNPTINKAIFRRASGFLVAFVICYLPLTFLEFLHVTNISHVFQDDSNGWTVIASSLLLLWGFMCVLLYGASRSCFRRLTNRCLGRRKPGETFLFTNSTNRSSDDLPPGEVRQFSLNDKNLLRLQVYEEIGYGGQGVVYHGVWRGTDVAVKQISVSKLQIDPDVERNLEGKISAEAQVLASLRHPKIVLFMAAGLHRGRLTIITQYCPRGSLYDVYRKRRNNFPWTQRLKIVQDAAEGLLYLHSSNPPYIHRDIKSMNILIDDGFNAKIGDFGTSRIIGFSDHQRGDSFRSSGKLSEKGDASGSAGGGTMTKLAGTIRWMAPEILRGGEDYTSKADVYSFGMMMYEVVALEIPFEDVKFESQVRKKVMAGMRPPIPNRERVAPPGFLQLIQDCWQDDPDARPGMQDVLLKIQSIIDQSQDDNRESTAFSRSALDSVYSARWSAMEQEESMSKGVGSYLTYFLKSDELSSLTKRVRKLEAASHNSNTAVGYGELRSPEMNSKSASQGPVTLLTTRRMSGGGNHYAGTPREKEPAGNRAEATEIC